MLLCADVYLHRGFITLQQAVGMTATYRFPTLWPGGGNYVQCLAAKDCRGRLVAIYKLPATRKLVAFLLNGSVSTMITATKANYIKLGEKGRYEKYCFNNGVVALGFYEVPDSKPFNPQVVYDTYKKLGAKPQTCTDYVRQIRCFYESDAQTLWFTLADGKLKWCFAEPSVKYIGANQQIHQNGSRHLNTIDGWHDCDINGNPLLINQLNGNLTKISGYQGTICTLEEERMEYLLRRINGEELPQIIEARKNRTEILVSIINMMRMLNPKDFELLVELVFAQSGWQRLSANGGTQKTIDIEMYLPSTDEYAFAQVKSETNQKQLEKYEKTMAQRTDKYMFYVYHTAKKELVPNDDTTKLINAHKLADMVLSAGLFNWLLKKAR